MKFCPVCNESFADELNFCDVDGTRLAREDSAQERNKWWSLLGAGLLVGAVLITAGSIIFLPRARVSPPVVNSEPKPTAVPAAASSSGNAADVAESTASSKTDSASSDALAPELKKKEKSLADSTVAGGAPNPKAAALAAEGVEKTAAANDAKTNDTSAAKPEPPLPVKSVGDTHAEAPPKPVQNPPDLKKDHQSQPVTAKSAGKDQDARKKSDDKDKKKGGFLRVFKKIFGKD